MWIDVRYRWTVKFTIQLPLELRNFGKDLPSCVWTSVPQGIMAFWNNGGRCKGMEEEDYVNDQINWCQNHWSKLLSAYQRHKFFKKSEGVSREDVVAVCLKYAAILIPRKVVKDVRRSICTDNDARSVLKCHVNGKLSVHGNKFWRMLGFIQISFTWRGKNYSLNKSLILLLHVDSTNTSPSFSS